MDADCSRIVHGRFTGAYFSYFRRWNQMPGHHPLPAVIKKTHSPIAADDDQQQCDRDQNADNSYPNPKKVPAGAGNGLIFFTLLHIRPGRKYLIFSQIFRNVSNEPDKRQKNHLRKSTAPAFCLPCRIRVDRQAENPAVFSHAQILELMTPCFISWK
jgi:hypothetical protein